MLAIRGGTLVDGSGDPPVPNDTLLIEGNRIRSVGPLPPDVRLEDCHVIEATGRWVLPVLAIYLVVGVLTAGLHPLAPAAFAALVAVQAAFFAAAGTYLAARCPTVKDFSWPTAWLGLAIVLPPLLLSVPLFWNTSPVNQGLALFGATRAFVWVAGGRVGVPVRVAVGRTTWTTSIFPSSTRGYVLPVKRAVRKAESLDVGDTASVTLELVDL